MPKAKPLSQDDVGPALSNEAPRFLFIYRSGSATPVNMTPRATDRNGLSAFRELPNKPGCKYQVIDTSKLNKLQAICDNPATGHFCIVPRDMSKMQEWMDTRGKETHVLTEELLNAIVSKCKT